MKQFLPLIIIGLFLVGLSASSCKRGNTVGAVGYPDPDGFQEFDTFDFPTADFYFYGKFDGGYKLWQDGLRSKWDTLSKDTSGDIDNIPWVNLPDLKNNIYRNIPEENGDLPCINDSAKIWYEQSSRFVRPGIPNERIEIFFYHCIDSLDTIPAFDPFHGAIGTYLGLINEGVARPFTNTQYGRNGVKVVYTDDERNKWETKPGSGQSIDTYMRINDFYPREIATDTLDTLAMYIVEGEFAGRLYNGNKELPITESKFRARLIPHVSSAP